MNFLFRADASRNIGLGHVMRCLSLADKLRATGWGVWFACRNWDGHAGELIQQRGHDLIWIDVGQDGKTASLGADNTKSSSIPAEQDAAACVAAIMDLDIDWLVVDHYGLDASWHKALRDSVGKIMVIDDLANREYDCDLLLDQTYGRSAEDYQRLVPLHCRLLLGADYALLRPEFPRLRFSALERRQHSRGIQRILVSMGGSDPNNLSSRVLEGLDQVMWPKPPQVDLVLGSGFAHNETIRKQVAEYSTPVNIEENVSNMGELMHDADLAIGAGGVTSWERCCLGLPTLIVQSADNQSTVISKLLAVGAVQKLEANERLSESVMKQVTEYLEKPALLAAMSDAAANVTRGLGVELVASRLHPKWAADGSPVVLRPAEADDMATIHSWQCHENTRRFSHNSQLPTLDEHSRWYRAKLIDPNSYFFIIVHDGVDGGVLRFDRIESSHPQLLISIYTAPGHYKQGLARSALEYAIDLFPQASLVADVLPENIVSQHLFSSAGFKQIAADRYVYAATNGR